MGCMKKFVIFTSLIVLLLALLLYHPVHEDIEDKTVMRVIHATNNLMKYVGYVGEWFGTHRYIAMRKFTMKLFDMYIEEKEEGIQERYETFNGVKVKMFSPEDTTEKSPRPGLVYLPGGGFFTGSQDSANALCGLLAKRLQIIIVTVNYRKIPEFPYPAQINDVISVLDYVNENAAALGINPNNIGIAGDSSGGNLAAAAALKLRDASHSLKLKYQVIIYPLLQGLTMNLPSHHMNEWHAMAITTKKFNAEKLLMLIGEDISLVNYVLEGNHTSAQIWKDYGHLVDPKQLPAEFIPSDYSIEDFGANRLKERNHGISEKSMKLLTDPYLYPLMATTMKNLPPTFMLTCELDPNRDDGILYVQRLKQNDNKVEHYHDRNGFHGILSFVKGRMRTEAGAKAAEALIKFLEPYVRQ